MIVSSITAATTLGRTARCGGETGGVLVLRRYGDRACHHLGAFNELGYRSRAARARCDVALQHLSSSARIVLLGAGAGDQDTGHDGLARFTRASPTFARVAWLGGRVLDPDGHARLSTRTHRIATKDFSIYRSPGRNHADRQ